MRLSTIVWLNFNVEVRMLYKMHQIRHQQTYVFSGQVIFLTLFFFLSGLYFHVVGEGVVNLSKKAESVTDRESYIDFRLRLLGEQGKDEEKK